MKGRPGRSLLRRIEQLERTPIPPEVLCRAQIHYRTTGEVPTNPKIRDHVLKVEAFIVLAERTMGSAHSDAHGLPWPPPDWNEELRRGCFQELARHQMAARRNPYLADLVRATWPPPDWPADLDPWPKPGVEPEPQPIPATTDDEET